MVNPPDQSFFPICQISMITTCANCLHQSFFPMFDGEFHLTSGCWTQDLPVRSEEELQRAAKAAAQAAEAAKKAEEEKSKAEEKKEDWYM